MLSRPRNNSAALSSRAKRGICFCVVISGLFFSAFSSAQPAPKRPRILGISHVDIYTTNLVDTRGFYRMILHPSGLCHWCEEIPRSPAIVPVNDQQSVMLWSSQTPPSSMMAQITFLTNDLASMKRFLTAKGITYSGPKGVSEITVTDPEGHTIGFSEHEHEPPWSPEVASMPRIIHTGIVVHDRAAEDHFYKDILGFHLYWQGGRKDDETDWVNMQVPDGTDWIEYMLNVPPDADHRTLGVVNHIALGVPDIHAAEAQLRKNGWTGGEEPKIGRGGKWQLNLYDPDDTRVELMEFTPTQKPCCSEYTGPHPKP